MSNWRKFYNLSMLSCMRHHMINVIMKKNVSLERWLSRKRLLLLLWNVRVQTRNKMLTKVLINIFKWTLTPTLSFSPVPGTPCLLTLNSPAQILGWASLSPASYYDPIFLRYSHWTKLPILVDDSSLTPPPLSPHMVWLFGHDHSRLFHTPVSQVFPHTYISSQILLPLLSFFYSKRIWISFSGLSCQLTTTYFSCSTWSGVLS